MKENKHIFYLTFLMISLVSQAQVSTIFNGIKFNDSLSVVREKLGTISGDIKTIEIAKPSFPLSNNKESHLIASIIKVGNEIIDRAVFTFADNKLCYIEAKGNVIKVLTSDLKSEMKKYLNYQVYSSDLLFINKEKDVAWILTKESVHPNLFTWNNPYLMNENVGEIKYNASAKTPSFIKMGENIDNLIPILKNHSSFVEVKKLVETDSITKTQINCFGIEYAGFPRKFEARFVNKKLNMVWILTGKGEENRIRKKLSIEFGDAVFVNSDWEVFNNWTVLLRKDKPEVLLLSKELGQMYKKQYSK